ncbi:MAG: hypothetical protein A2359_03080 [Candidatus Moranbacteria bacterium RIFOXYB1_FULL_43_19]|nr:MAG: hypothetical protein A2359_03080 [Candidatus Moranbacteria bacterium RIFOXYB1_FULL_43_19]OGI28534.1 MAG: hypothetical protein A2184_00690 [Candidatus Moranbacteria bacterium RIFOXYA1_FULL_44_7]OGI33662.1 MAG: hypothetical protein A2420_02340 [Candidatus Moranbacteria bacterium RIFOXYC1_FULL_44_13]OGI37205.1 MAG: hypothetical protein A2612_03950 [Candidatus Moranbacteria bacterium RIFOXYD1_FULL_44_12]
MVKKLWIFRIFFFFSLIFSTNAFAADRQGVWEALHFDRLYQEYVLWHQWADSGKVKFEISKYSLIGDQEKEEVFCSGEIEANSILIAKDFFNGDDGIVFARREGSSGNLSYSFFCFYPYARKLEKVFPERFLECGSLTVEGGRLIEWSSLRSTVIELEDGKVIFKDEIVGKNLLLYAGGYVISFNMSDGKISARLGEIIRRKKKVITMDRGALANGSTINIPVGQGIILIRTDRITTCEKIRIEGEALKIITPNVSIGDKKGESRISIEYNHSQPHSFELKVRAN